MAGGPGFQFQFQGLHWFRHESLGQSGLTATGEGEIDHKKPVGGTVDVDVDAVSHSSAVAPPPPPLLLGGAGQLVRRHSVAARC